MFQLYTGEPLIPTDGKNREGDDQVIIDHLHLMTCNMGALSKAFIESIPEKWRSDFFKSEGSDYVIAGQPTDETQKEMNFYQSIAHHRPNGPIWQARMYHAARTRRENRSNAQKLIELIGPMLRYENRITADDALFALTGSRPCLMATPTSIASSSTSTSTTAPVTFIVAEKSPQVRATSTVSSSTSTSSVAPVTFIVAEKSPQVATTSTVSSSTSTSTSATMIHTRRKTTKCYDICKLC